MFVYVSLNCKFLLQLQYMAACAVVYDAAVASISVATVAVVNFPVVAVENSYCCICS